MNITRNEKVVTNYKWSPVTTLCSDDEQISN